MERSRYFLSALRAVLQQGGYMALLDEKEEKALLHKCLEGDSQARETLIKHNMRLVLYIVSGISNAGIGAEDLSSIGFVGLLKAIDSFDLKKNVRLATYASKCILNEIYMFLRKENKHYKISLDVPHEIGDDGQSMSLMDLLTTETNIAEDEAVRNLEGRETLAVIKRLESPYRDILISRFGLCGRPVRTQSEIAKTLNMTQSCISKMEKKAIEKVRRALG